MEKMVIGALVAEGQALLSSTDSPKSFYNRKPNSGGALGRGFRGGGGVAITEPGLGVPSLVSPLVMPAPRQPGHGSTKQRT